MNRKYPNYNRYHRRRRRNPAYALVFLLLTLAILTLLVVVFISNARSEINISSPVSQEDSKTGAIGDSNSSGATSTIDDASETFANSSEESIVDETSEPYAYEYAIDIEPYLEYIDPEMTEENKEYFWILVNKENPLGADYVPPDLVVADYSLVKAGYEGIKLNATACKALEALIKEAAANGFDKIRMSSGYRSYALQEWWFNYYKDQYRNSYPDESELEAFVSTFSMPPGNSEHQTGLAVDMYDTDTNATFAGTPAANWLAENAHKFGFILRYPEDKVDITKIMYESWHFRFVGRTAATYIYENDLTLEEFVEMQ